MKNKINYSEDGLPSAKFIDSFNLLVILPPVFVVPLMHVIQERLASPITVSILILNLLLDVDEVLLSYVPFQVFAEHLGRPFEVLLVVLEDDRLVRLLQVVGEDVRVHERLPALAEDVDGLPQELHLDPAHVVLLHLLHFVLDGGVQFVFEFERLHVVHVTVAVEEVSLERRSRFFLRITGGSRFFFIVPTTMG